MASYSLACKSPLVNLQGLTGRQEQIKPEGSLKRWKLRDGTIATLIRVIDLPEVWFADQMTRQLRQ